jgi:hypothetical protein
MMKAKQIATSVVAAFAVGYGATAMAIPSPGAVADALLTFNNFTLFTGNNALGKSFVGLPIGTNVTLGPIQTNADTLADINGATSTGTTSVGLGIPFSLTNTAGPNGALFVPNTTLPVGTLAAGTYAGSHSSSVGNAIAPAVIATPCGVTLGDCVIVHNQVNLNQFSTVGSAQANQNLLTQFTVEVLGPVRFEMNLDGTGFLRAALGQDGVSANAFYSWSVTVASLAGGGNILQWTPNGAVLPDIAGISNNGLLLTEGSCVAAGTCEEYADAFATNTNVGLLSTGDTATSTSGTFEVELTLAPGTYTFTISHQTTADAEIARAVPEPATMALLGLGLLGLGIGARRRRQV